MTTPVEMGADNILGGFEPGFDVSDRAIETRGDDALDREINDRRAQLESAETLRLVRAL